MFKKGIDLLTSQMKGEWPRVPVSDIATAVIGGTPRRSVAEYWDGNLPWATAKDVARVPSRYLDEVQENITEAGLESSTTKLMPAGTVVITARGTVGALAQLRREMAFNQTCYAILPGDSINNNFLFYALKGTITEMRALTYGTVFDTITRRTFDDWLLPLPPLTEQRVIAHILGTLDDKIELNRRMNETLEEMARAIFKSWFVDFDPVRAKMDGSWRRGESLPGMPAEMYDLFPERLVDSELGEIPEGWGVKALDEIANFRNGLALQKLRPKENEERLPVVKIAQLRRGKADSDEWATTSITPECIIDDGDIIFSWSGSLLVKVWCGGRAALNQHLFKVTSRQYPKWFYLHCTQSHLPEFQRIAADKATTMGHIKRHHLSEAKCVIPNQTLLSAVDDTFVNFLSKCITINVESRTLADLRDTMLPKLISGELRVRDAEKFMESVV